MAFYPLPKDAHMMLSLIQDVFTEAHPVLGPTIAGMQKTSAGGSVKFNLDCLQWLGSSKPIYSLTCFRQR